MFFSFNFNPYIAMIGDIRDSKKIDKRKNVQDRLSEVLDDINSKYCDDIASKFKITLGDEFQGLLKNGAHVMDILSEIEIGMYPIQLRYGIGIGEITTDINPDIPLGSDGPAYYNARDAIDFLKNRKRKSKASDIWIIGDKSNEGTVTLLNTILSMGAIIKHNWTDRQREIIHDYIRYKDNQNGVAKRLGITQSSVQKGLSNGEYYSYEEAMIKVSQALSQIRREDV